MSTDTESKLPHINAIIALAIICGMLGYFFAVTFITYRASETIVTQIIQVLSSAGNFILGFYFGGMYQKKKAEISGTTTATVSADITTTETPTPEETK